ncbi:Eco47II family restriction endonuclease [Morganella morganii]|uniref:Eco47II family restriction endonuclease n=1 Tax=Morganella morganii TaxID=582 RepID=UPI00298E4DA6|nr:Eco47II family restriction endonuclease [Morganella morganii]MDW7782629.1 Eco47II family restriction endonuclease [Morganella morganii]MDW7790008.1 Eco47II family restriction endonuclease [Morganella morganii]
MGIIKMAYLTYVSDDVLVREVKFLLDKALKKRKDAEKSFNKNVIDPFGALFEAPAFNNHAEWKNAEMARQCQKTIQNHVGTFHQRILGSVDGWEDLGVGGIVDLVNNGKKIIAEVKNKYSTVTGGNLAAMYNSLDAQVSPKNSRYKDYTAYFVNIIPKHPARSDVPFIPSDKEKGQKCHENEKIRCIDGASFYTIVTGRESALSELHSALPEVIEHVYRNNYGKTDFSIPDPAEFTSYFHLAYGE